ncbi:ABC transporter substrate-binding protein [Streptacidiphilus sp. EB129]|jgi:polar amino acid transport system substrate-binding protein|uniref:ABC transporter substrate-binding protein n=1 Tax=Streptacidiphilus sp. EB129 TaxID=3156262 RepID=UPI0035182717
MARSIAQRLVATGAVVAAGSLLLTGCGSSKIGGNSGAAPNASQTVNAEGTDAALVALLPADIKAKGNLTIATDSTYAPDEFKDAGGNVVGMDVDLGNAILKKLGLTATWQSADFGSILGGISAKKYDLSLSSFTDTKAREAQVDLVQYFNAGEAIAVLAGNPDKVDGNAANLCGFKVSVQSNTTESDEIKNTINPACKKAGKPTVPNDGDQFAAQTDATTALTSKRDQAMMADSPVIDYAVKQSNGVLQKIGQNYNNAPYGIVVPKGSALGQAIAGALKDLIADGTYGQILTKWGVDSGAITADKVVLNGATS